MEFKIGDNVITTKEHDNLPSGSKGKIVEFMSTGSAGLELKKEFRYAHHCNGVLSKENGYYVDKSKLKLQLKLTKKKRDELKKKAINYIKKNKDYFKCFNSNLEELKKDVESWSEGKLLDFK